MLLLQAMRLQYGGVKRRALEDALNNLGTEIHCLTHIHYVFSPLHFRSPQNWKFKQLQKGQSVQKEAALSKARVSLLATLPHLLKVCRVYGFPA